MGAVKKGRLYDTDDAELLGAVRRKDGYGETLSADVTEELYRTPKGRLFLMIIETQRQSWLGDKPAAPLVLVSLKRMSIKKVRKWAARVGHTGILAGLATETARL